MASSQATLADPRQAWKVVYPLTEIMLAILVATLAGADDFVEIEACGNENLRFLRGFPAWRRHPQPRRAERSRQRA